MTSGTITGVSRSASHEFSKTGEQTIRLLEGLGVEGDSHAGRTVQHRSRVKRDPTQPNLRQVHLIHDELHAELRDAGFRVAAGDLGENITTHGVELLALPAGTRVALGDEAVVQLTGLRNPCHQLDDFQSGLMDATLSRAPDGKLIRKAGVMAIVVAEGEVRAGDPIRIQLPPEPHAALEPV